MGQHRKKRCKVLDFEDDTEISAKNESQNFNDILVDTAGLVRAPNKDFFKIIPVVCGIRLKLLIITVIKYINFFPADFGEIQFKINRNELASILIEIELIEVIECLAGE